MRWRKEVEDCEDGGWRSWSSASACASWKRMPYGCVDGLPPKEILIYSERGFEPLAGLRIEFEIL